MRSGRLFHCLAVVAASRYAVAAPAPDDIPAFQLKGPFATRAEACEAALGRPRSGDCATYRVATKLTATRDWKAIEVGVVGDDQHDYATTKHYGIFVQVGNAWFGDFLGTDGFVDMEYFPPCDGPRDNCTPFHRRDAKSYTVPTLSLLDVVKGGAKEIVMFYPTGADVGFRELTPTAELVQVCGLSADRVPSCTGELIAVTASRARLRSPSELFHGTDEMTVVDDETATVGHLRFR